MTPDDLTRAFPFTVRPVHLETLDSYTRRTIAVNGEHPRLPAELVTFAQKSGLDMAWPQILAAKVGRDVSRLDTPRVRGIHEECAPCIELLADR